MPEGTATLEQIEWANQYLRILGEESEEEAPKERDAPEGEDRYGQDGYLLVDTRPLPKALKDAVDAGQLPTAEDWDKTSMGPSQKELEDFAKDKVAIQDNLKKYSDIPGLSGEKSTLNDKWDKLEKVIDDDGPWPCDLGPPEGSVKKKDRNTTFQKIKDDYFAKKDEIDKIREGGKRCAALLDAPANNPERKKVGKVLAELEAIDTQMTDGALTPEDHSQAKCKKLYEMQKELFAWNDRRAKNNLPPSAEAVAMGELLQKAHQKMTEDIIKNKWPIVVADEDRLSEDEKKHIQETWANLRDDTEKARDGEATEGKLIVAPEKRPPVTTDEELEQFRNETLSDFMRLMGSEAGRHLINRINEGNHKVTLAPQATGFSCSRLGDGHTRAKDGTKGTGGESRVNMQFGAKDSGRTYTTASGTVVFSPRFLTMGHELIHAMHNSRGSNRTAMDLPDGLDKKWNNPEEYRTIFQGKTSERALRDQFGLSAVRFGHLDSDPGKQAGDAYQAEIDAQDELDKIAEEAAKKDSNVPAVEDALKGRGWDPDALGNPMKLALYKDDTLTGPLPDGWDANQLTVGQIKAVLDKTLDAKLPALGWTPYDLTDVARLEEVLAKEEHHPSSKLGRRFQSLGGEAALAEVATFNAQTRSKLPTGDDTSWPTKVKALEDCHPKLKDMAAHLTDADLTKLLASDAKLLTKLPKVQEALKAHKNAQKASAKDVADKTKDTADKFDAARVTQLETDGKAEGSKLAAVIAAMKKVSDRLKDDKATDDAAPLVKDLKKMAGTYVRKHQKAKRSKGKARLAAAQTILDEATATLTAIREVNDKVKAATETLEAQLTRNPARAVPFGALNKMLRSPLVTKRRRKAARKAIKEARALKKTLA